MSKQESKYELLNTAAGYAWGLLGTLIIATVFTLILSVPLWKSFIIVYLTAWLVFVLNGGADKL